MFIKRSIIWFAALALIAVVLLPGSTVIALPLTTVNIAGSATGTLPAPYNVGVGTKVAIHVQGDSTSLKGWGTSHSTTGCTEIYSLAGSITGGIVQLSGTVTKSTAPTVGTPVVIVANRATGEFTYTFGPITDGPLAGITVVFAGSAKIIVVGE